jgi:hypothetical protein
VALWSNWYLLEGLDEVDLGADGAALHVGGEGHEVGQEVPVWDGYSIYITIENRKQGGAWDKVIRIS